MPDKAHKTVASPFSLCCGTSINGTELVSISGRSQSSGYSGHPMISSSLTSLLLPLGQASLSKYGTGIGLETGVAMMGSMGVIDHWTEGGGTWLGSDVMLNRSRNTWLKMYSRVLDRSRNRVSWSSRWHK